MTRFIKTILLLVSLMLGLAVAQTQVPAEGQAAYEVWALDQGTNTIYIINPELEVAEVVELPEGIDMPHMIDFTADYAYGFIASPASGNTAVIRVADREIVAVVETGPGSHMASVSPQDQVIVDVMGDGERVPGQLVELLFDRETETAEIGRSLIVREDPVFDAGTAEGHLGRPVCHDYTADGRYAYITFGPALSDGVLALFDTESFTIERVFNPEEVQGNCGTILSPDGSRFFVNGGSVEFGQWYAIDTETHEVIHQNSSRGTDAHGVWFTPDGSELWMVNRHSSNAIIIDPETLEITDEIAFVGKSPDILAISPDSRYVFITLRGPNQRSGPHAIAGTTPGVAVIDAQTREIVTIIEPDQGNEKSDFHGIGLVPRSQNQ